MNFCQIGGFIVARDLIYDVFSAIREDGSGKKGIFDYMRAGQGIAIIADKKAAAQTLAPSGVFAVSILTPLFKETPIRF